VSATITESKSGASETTDVPQEIHDLRKTWRFRRPHRPVLTPHRQQLMREPGRRWSLPAPDSSSACSSPLPSPQRPASNDVSESDAPIPESDDEYPKHDDAPSDAEKAREEQAKQEESGQENPT
jgi:hypothetical protein